MLIISKNQKLILLLLSPPPVIKKRHVCSFPVFDCYFMYTSHMRIFCIQGDDSHHCRKRFHNLCLLICYVLKTLNQGAIFISLFRVSSEERPQCSHPLRHTSGTEDPHGMLVLINNGSKYL